LRKSSIDDTLLSAFDSLECVLMQWVDLLLITNRQGPRILLLEEDAGWTLPCPSPREDHFWQSVGPVNRAAARLGYSVTTLRCLSILHDAQTDQLHCYYALELHDDTPSPLPGHHWLAADDLPQAPLVSGEQRMIIAAWLAGIPTQVPWYAPGYASAVEGWATETLLALGRTASRPIEQVRNWERGALWYLPTNAGAVYTKAVPALFHYEPVLSAQLAAWLPGHTAPVLAYEQRQGLFIMEDIGTHSLADTRDPLVWRTAMRRFAELQIALSDRADELLVLGVPDRRLTQLPVWLDELVFDELALHSSAAGLSDKEIEALRTRVTRLREACVELTTSPLPASLEHGDFSPSQVLVGERGPAVVDWSDSSLTHPFLSMGFLTEPSAPLPDVSDPVAWVRQVYLEPWQQFASLDQPQELMAVALKLAPLHHALIYHRTILPCLENRWEMERMLPYYLRRLL
jgi:hypothetical protein